tara:strand:+ start:1781 stop:3844 length:2064 start_codon:yes stop_codon:yes gene_type:complete
MKVWMADLTYTQQTLSSDIFPAAIAGMIEYAKNTLDFEIDHKIFKFPENLSKAFESEKPDVIGFSNYIWNCNLGLSFAKAIRENHPEILIVMGGPNFPVDSNGQKSFLEKNRQIDFYIYKEGEEGWVKILDILSKNLSSDRVSKIKERKDDLVNTAFIDSSGSLFISKTDTRMSNLKEMTSPYVNGTLDKFFGGRLLPIIQTNRGCPFTCTFCTEGQSYWSRVRKKSQDVVNAEIEYISKKISEFPDDKKRYELYISDSNFGMFKEDIETCKFIANMQEEYSYPKYISVTTGKNKKERVLEAAKLVNGAIKLSGSVQSLDEEVLESVKRKNISADKLLEVAKQAQGVKSNVVSEVILGLPTDSKKKHFYTLKSLVDSSFNTIIMYQLMMLPGTEMNVASSREKFGFNTRFRVLPRCFGYFDIFGDTIVAAEIEEIAIENNTLSFQDYLDCRKMSLVINIFYNEGIFEEIVKVLENIGISPFSWLEKIYDNTDVDKFNSLVSQYIDESTNELWESKSDLEVFANNVENIKKYISGEYGNNLLAKYKALSLTEYFDSVCEIAAIAIEDIIDDHGYQDREILDLTSEIIKFKRLRVSHIFDMSFKEYEFKFKYNVGSDLLRLSESVDSDFNHKKVMYKSPKLLKFKFSDTQKSMIKSYSNLFGSDLAGLSKTLSRVYLRQFFREVVENKQ